MLQDNKYFIFRIKVSSILFILFGLILYLSYLFVQENKISENNYLSKFRTEHPEFKDVSDTDLAKDIYTVFYKDMKEEDYYKRIGIDSPKKQKEQKILLYMSIVMAIFFLYLTIKRISLLSEFKNSISKNIKQISIIVFSILLLTILFLSTGGIYEYKSDNRGIPMFRINKITGNLQGLKSGEWTDIIREVR